MVERIPSQDEGGDMDWEATENDEGWGVDDDGEDWGESGDTGGHEYAAADMADIVTNDKGYFIVKSQETRKQVLAKIEELQELYEMDLNALILIARHYSWNQDRM